MDKYAKTNDLIKDKIQDIFDPTTNEVTNRIYSYAYIDEQFFQKFDDFVNFAENEKSFLKSKGFLLDEVHFYFTENEEKDAFGGIQYGLNQSEDLSFVTVSKGLVERHIKYCDLISNQLNKLIRKKRLPKDIKGKIDVSDILGDLSLSDFLFLIGRDFIFNHEIAHVIQCEGKPRPVPGTNQIDSENTSRANNENYSEQHHIGELDADQFAARAMCKKVLSYYNNLPVEKRTRDNLANLMAFALLGIYILFHILSNEMKSKFFFKNTKHPHQSIRMQAIIQTVNGTFDLYTPSGYIFNKHRMTSIFSNLSVQVTGSVENFLAHITPKNISARRQKDISNYLDEMMQKTMELDWTLTKREIG
jgi:hypothetical protein